MLTFISFVIVMIGAFNWFFIGAFQYDFIAGFFGSQASLLSRLIYFLVGMAAFVLIAMVFKNKGNIKVTENSFKKRLPEKEKEMNRKEIDKEQENQEKLAAEKAKNKENMTFSKFDYPEDKFSESVNYEKNSNTHHAISEEKESHLGYKDFDISQYD